MKFCTILFAGFAILGTCYAITGNNVNSRSAFSTVSAFGGLSTLYLKMNIREPHIDPNTTIDAETKSSICKSITESNFFDFRQEYPIDMDTIFRELNDLVQREEEQSNPNTYFKKIMQDYEERGIWRTTYTYHTRLMTVDVGSLQMREFGFACATKSRKADLAIYYISDEYNLNTAIDVPTEGTIGARFVFRCASNSCELMALAEEPAKAFTNVEYCIEDIYIRMRKFYNAAPTASDDPLCGLTKEEKLRICTTVMNSSYFVGKIKFFPDMNSFNEKCEMKEISFQTDEVKREVQSGPYREWMLSCNVEPITLNARDTYYVSRAYHPHYAVVYSEVGDWYIENISANISLIVETHMEIKKESKGLPPPNLLHQLRLIDEL